MATDAEIEKEIQTKGLTAPRVTPERIESVIVTQYFFTAAEGVEGSGVELPFHTPLKLLTICVLVLQNGFTVMGKSACASPENFNAELGRKIARQDAVNQIWSLEGYALRNALYHQGEQRGI